MTIVLLLGYGLYTLVMVNIWSGLIAFVAKSWCVFKYTKTTINISYFNKNELKELLGFSGWATIISLCKRLIFTISPTILGFFCGSASIAVFGIANAIDKVPGNVDFHFDFGFPPQTSFACMAETMILALEKRYENFTLGRKLTIEQIDTISQLARKHDFSLAGFRNFERAVTDEEIAHIQGFVEQELAMRNI